MSSLSGLAPMPEAGVAMSGDFLVLRTTSKLHDVLTEIARLDDETQHVQLVLNNRLEQCALKEEALSTLKREQLFKEDEMRRLDKDIKDKMETIEALELRLLSSGIPPDQLDGLEDPSGIGRKVRQLRALWASGKAAATMPGLLAGARSIFKLPTLTPGEASRSTAD